MKKESNKWYQVRIFVRNVDEDCNYHWSWTVLGDIVKQFSEEYPKVRFWFTKYYCPLTTDGFDSEGIPDEYLTKGNWARSLRFRFKPTHKRHIQRIEELLTQHNIIYWHCGIQPYDHMEDLCGSRFIENGYVHLPTLKEKKRRGDLVQKALEYNCRLILDCLTKVNLHWELETNNNDNNLSFGNISRSMIHLYVNPWTTSKGEMLPIYGIDWTAIYGI